MNCELSIVNCQLSIVNSAFSNFQIVKKNATLSKKAAFCKYLNKKSYNHFTGSKPSSFSSVGL